MHSRHFHTSSTFVALHFPDPLEPHALNVNVSTPGGGLAVGESETRHIPCSIDWQSRNPSAVCLLPYFLTDWRVPSVDAWNEAQPIYPAATCSAHGERGQSVGWCARDLSESESDVPFHTKKTLRPITTSDFIVGSHDSLR